MSVWAIVSSAGIGAIVGAAISGLFQFLDRLRLRHQLAVGRARVRGLLREARFYTDRARNEILHRNTVGIYRDGWQKSVDDLRFQLDAGNNDLSPKEVESTYAAAFCCKETIFASDHGFKGTGADDLHKPLLERVDRALSFVAAAQDATGDTDPEAYYRGVCQSAD
jgi:hypothetical protein